MRYLFVVSRTDGLREIENIYSGRLFTEFGLA